MNGRCRGILVAGVGFMMSLLSAAVGGADTLVVGDAVESAAGWIQVPRRHDANDRLHRRSGWRHQPVVARWLHYGWRHLH